MLCRSVGNLNRLVLRRSDAFPQNHMRFSFAAEVTVTVASKVREAARALCALPRMPSGTFHCPADFGIAYHLVFSAGDRAFPPPRWTPPAARWSAGSARCVGRLAQLSSGPPWEQR